MAALEEVVWKIFKPNERPENKGLQLLDANETLEEEKDNVDAETKSNENGDEDQANTQVEEEPPKIAASTSTNIYMVFLEEIQEREAKNMKAKNLIQMMPSFANMKNTVTEAHPKCLKHSKPKQEKTL